MSNNIAAFVPELWARESVAILEENMMISQLINRDFSPTIARFGETVHTRKPAEFSAKNKTVNDDVTTQDISATDIAVKLDQCPHVSFLIRDGEESISFENLVQTYIRPAALALARRVDQILLGQFPRFFATTYGKIGGLTTSTSIGYITGIRQKMNRRKVPMDGRRFIWTPEAETQLISTETFHSAEKVGDSGSALREASIGRKLGFDHFMCQNMSYVESGNTTKTNAVNNVSGYAAGSTSITYDGAGDPAVGEWCTIAGDDTPQRITADSGTVLTISPGLRHAVVNDAVITTYTAGAINNVGGYAAGYSKEIVVDGFTVAPKVGQFLTIGNTSTVYTVIGAPTTTLIELDRPLAADVADDATVNLGPAGNYNFAFHRNAITFVNRPMIQPNPQLGVVGAVFSGRNIAIRVTMTYEGKAQGTRVTLDTLCGVQLLDADLGAVCFA